MQKHLENIINIYPALKEICLKLKNINFTPYNIIHNSKCTKILAKKEDEHLHDLEMTIDYVTNCATITIKTRLIWAEHTKLSLPGHDIQLEIDGESDYDYNYDHSFILRATKTETHVKVKNLVETIESMSKEIQAAHKDLIKS